MSWLAPLGVLVLAGLLGHPLAARFASDDEQGRGYRWLLAVLAGIVALYSWMQLLDLASVPWRRWSVLLVPSAVALVLTWRRATPRRDASRPALGWGDAVAAVAVGTVALLLAEPCATMSDVVFHWGIKAQRYVLAGGVDYTFLARPWNELKRPDYPNLVPSLYAATTLARGIWTEPTVLAWSGFYVVALLIGARETLATAGVARATAQAGTVMAVAAAGAFAVAFILGGSPDLLISALVVAALPPLLGRPTLARAGQIGILAAVAAGAKVEGTSLAILWIMTFGWRARGTGLSWRPASARLLLPPLVVAVPWWAQTVRHGLVPIDRAGVLEIERFGLVMTGVWQAMLDPAWHGFGLAVGFLPALFVFRVVRAPALVLTAQGIFYLLVYLTAATDPVHLIATSAHRLLLHLVPAILLLGVIVWHDPKKCLAPLRDP